MTSNFNLIRRQLLGLVFLGGLIMIPALIYGLAFNEKQYVSGLLLTSLACLVLGGVGAFANKDISVKIKARDSYTIVLASWLLMIGLGTLPYYLSGMGYSFVDCIFESTAGFTTCNSWVLDVDTMPKALLLWKATSNWIGGMGIVLLTIMLLSSRGSTGQKLAEAEVPGPQLVKSSARMYHVAKITYFSYALLSLIEFLLLKLGGIPSFDALINTMSSISTAGLVDYKGGVSSNFTPYIKTVLIVFSIIASMNFLVYIKFLSGRIKEAFMDYELRVFLGLLAGSTVFVASALMVSGQYDNFAKALIDGGTGVVSFGCTTGFNIDNLSTWPSACKLVLLVLMIIGGCANSTCGGIKVIRSVVFAKLVRRGVFKRIHPRSVKPIMIEGEPISAGNASSISTYILIFFGVYLFGALVFSFENLDMETTLSGPLALLTNTGTGFGATTMGNFALFKPYTKLFGSLLMLAGRLEIYAILIVFSRSFWYADRVK